MKGIFAADKKINPHFNLMKKLGLLLIPLFICHVLWSQNTDRLGVRLKLKSDISTASSWNFKSGLESRQIFRELVHGVEEWRGYKYERTSFSVLAGRPVEDLGKLHAGYMIRRLGTNWVHRGIQQIAWSSGDGFWTFKQRVRLDQTFQMGKNPSFRLRYRIGSNLPLNGTSLEAREWYFSWSHEHMPIHKAGLFTYEIRLNLMVGYLFENSSKVSTGLEGRWSDITLDRKEYQLWWKSIYSFDL